MTTTAALPMPVAAALADGAPRNLGALAGAATGRGWGAMVERDGDVWTLVIGTPTDSRTERYTWRAGKWSASNPRGYRAALTYYRAETDGAPRATVADADAWPVVADVPECAECTDGSCVDCKAEAADVKGAEELRVKACKAHDRVSKGLKSVKAAYERGNAAQGRAEAAAERARAAAAAEDERLSARVAYADAVTCSLAYGSAERTRAGLEWLSARWDLGEGPASAALGECEEYAARVEASATEGWADDDRKGWGDAHDAAEHAHTETMIEFGTFEREDRNRGVIVLPSLYDAESAWEIIDAHSRDMARFVREAEAAADAAESDAAQCEAWADAAEAAEGEDAADAATLFTLPAPDVRQVDMARAHWGVSDTVAEEWAADAAAVPVVRVAPQGAAETLATAEGPAEGEPTGDAPAPVPAETAAETPAPGKRARKAPSVAEVERARRAAEEWPEAMEARSLGDRYEGEFRRSDLLSELSVCGERFPFRFHFASGGGHTVSLPTGDVRGTWGEVTGAAIAYVIAERPAAVLRAADETARVYGIHAERAAERAEEHAQTAVSVGMARAALDTVRAFAQRIDWDGLTDEQYDSARGAVREAEQWAERAESAYGRGDVETARWAARDALAVARWFGLDAPSAQECAERAPEARAVAGRVRPEASAFLLRITRPGWEGPTEKAEVPAGDAPAGSGVTPDVPAEEIEGGTVAEVAPESATSGELDADTSNGDSAPGGEGGFSRELDAYASKEVPEVRQARRKAEEAERHAVDARERAEGLQSAASAHYGRFAGGQKILMGHGSAPGALRDRARGDAATRKAIAATEEAKRAEVAARGARQAAELAETVAGRSRAWERADFRAGDVVEVRKAYTASYEVVRANAKTLTLRNAHTIDDTKARYDQVISRTRGGCTVTDPGSDSAESQELDANASKDVPEEAPEAAPVAAGPRVVRRADKIREAEEAAEAAGAAAGVLAEAAEEAALLADRAPLGDVRAQTAADAAHARWYRMDRRAWHARYEADRLTSEAEQTRADVERARAAAGRLLSGEVPAGRGAWLSEDGGAVVTFPLEWESDDNPAADKDGAFVGMLADAVAARDAGRKLKATDVPSKVKTGRGPGADFRAAVATSGRSLVEPWKAPRIPAEGKPLDAETLSTWDMAGDVISETEAAPGVWLPMAAVQLAETALGNGWTVAMQREDDGRTVAVRAAGTAERRGEPVAYELFAVWVDGAWSEGRSGVRVNGERYRGGAPLWRPKASGRQAPSILGTLGHAAEAGTLAAVAPAVTVSAPAPAGVSDPGTAEAWEGDGGAVPGVAAPRPMAQLRELDTDTSNEGAAPGGVGGFSPELDADASTSPADDVAEGAPVAPVPQDGAALRDALIAAHGNEDAMRAADWWCDSDCVTCADGRECADCETCVAFAAPWPARWARRRVKGGPERQVHVCHGPGGMSEGQRLALGGDDSADVDAVGIENEADAAATARAAGYTIIHADVRTVDPRHPVLMTVERLHFSTPCPTISRGGKGSGVKPAEVERFMDVMFHAAEWLGHIEVEDVCQDYGGPHDYEPQQEGDKYREAAWDPDAYEGTWQMVCGTHDEDTDECGDDCTQWIETQHCMSGRAAATGTPDEFRAAALEACADQRTALMAEVLLWPMAMLKGGGALQSVTMEQSDNLMKSAAPLCAAIETELRESLEFDWVSFQVECASRYGAASRRSRTWMVAVRDGEPAGAVCTADRDEVRAYESGLWGGRKDKIPATRPDMAYRVDFLGGRQPLPALTVAQALGWDSGLVVDTRGVRGIDPKTGKPKGGGSFSADVVSQCVTATWYGATLRRADEAQGCASMGRAFTQEQLAALVGFRWDYPWQHVGRGAGIRNKAQMAADAVSPFMGMAVTGATVKRARRVWYRRALAYQRALYTYAVNLWTDEQRALVADHLRSEDVQAQAGAHGFPRVQVPPMLPAPPVRLMLERGPVRLELPPGSQVLADTGTDAARTLAGLRWCREFADVVQLAADGRLFPEDCGKFRALGAVGSKGRPVKAERVRLLIGAGFIALDSCGLILATEDGREALRLIAAAPEALLSEADAMAAVRKARRARQWDSKAGQDAHALPILPGGGEAKRRAAKARAFREQLTERAEESRKETERVLARARIRDRRERRAAEARKAAESAPCRECRGVYPVEARCGKCREAHACGLPLVDFAALPPAPGRTRLALEAAPARPALPAARPRARRVRVTVPIGGMLGTVPAAALGKTYAAPPEAHPAEVAASVGGPLSRPAEARGFAGVRAGHSARQGATRQHTRQGTRQPAGGWAGLLQKGGGRGPPSPARPGPGRCQHPPGLTGARQFG